MGNFGIKEILVILLIILILFGGKRIPELARGMGKGVREFKDGMRGDAKDDSKDVHPEDKKS